MGMLALVAAIAPCLLAAGTAPAAARWAAARGLRDDAKKNKKYGRPVPLGGGIPVVVAVTAVLGAGGLAVLWFARQPFRPAWFPEAAWRHVPGAAAKVPQLFCVLAAAAGVFLVGLADDIRGLKPRTKLLLEAVLAALLPIAGVSVTLFLPGTPAGKILGGALTVFWVVGLTNAFNLLDHADGVCAGTALVAALCFFAAAAQTGQLFIAGFLLVLAGALAGFLVHNLPPARMFLGDAGSLYTGFVLAALTVLFTFYRARHPVYVLGVPLAVLAVPLFDAGAVAWMRLREGRPLFSGDRRHLAHRLEAAGLGPRRAAVAVWLLTAATGLSAVVLYQVDVAGAVLVLVQVAGILVLASLLIGKEGT